MRLQLLIGLLIVSILPGCSDSKDAAIARAEAEAAKAKAEAELAKLELEKLKNQAAQSPAKGAGKSESNPHKLFLLRPKVDGHEVEINGAVDAKAGVQRIVWDWGDGKPESESWFPAKHRYEKEGAYEVRVKSVDSQGATSTGTATVTVSGMSPSKSVAKSPAREKSPAGSSTAGAPSTPPPGPLVFEHTLRKPGFKKVLTVAHGQYGAQPKLEPGVGVQLAGGHTAPALWAKEYLGEKYRAEFEVKLDTVHAWVVCVLNGPGYGNSHEVGYGCRINTRSVTLFRDGKQEESIEKETPHGEWVRVEANANGRSIEVFLDGVPFAAMEDAKSLTGPAHGWFGLVGREVTFRNLKIWSPESDTKRERLLTPPVSEKPAANGKLLYELKLSGNELGKEWLQTQPQHTNVKESALVLQGPNGSPHVVLDKALNGDVACEVEFEYHDTEAVNFGLALLYLPKAPASIEEINRSEALQVALPDGHGNSAILWQKKSDGTQGVWREGERLSSTGYFAPIPDRKYVARLEANGDEVRLFLDGGLLLKASRTAPPSTSQAFFCIRQIYGGSKVHAARVYEVGK